MKFTGFIVLFLCVLKCASENSSKLRFRNTLLRVYIATDKKKVIGEYSDKLVKKVLTKYYDINLFYNTLSREDRDLIEAIVSLY